MHVLVTGHTGFKGAWLVLMLKQRGYDVSGLALEPVDGALYECASVGGDLIHDLRVDIRDGEATRDAITTISPDVVLHLAAQPLVRESYRDPRTTFETNILGTLNVLEAVGGLGGVRAQLIVTTDKVYRNDHQIWGYRENDALGGVDPYSASKAAADIVTQSWIASSGDAVPTAIARAGNVIGGGDVCADRLMVDLLAGFAAGQTVSLRYPQSVRPWQHVLDCLSGYLDLMDALLRGEASGEAFNFGPGSDSFVDVGTVASAVATLWGEDAKVSIDEGDHVHEAGLLALDARKAELQLGWRGRLGFSEALGWTVAWHKRVEAGESARDVTLAQIREFDAIRPQKLRP